MKRDANWDNELGWVGRVWAVLLVVALAVAVGLLGLFTVACGPVPPPAPPPVPPAPPAATVRAVAIMVQTATGKGVAGAGCTISDTDGPKATTTTDSGYGLWAAVSVGLRDTQVSCTADGYVPASEYRRLETSGNEQIDAPLVMAPTHFDPSTLTTDQLRRWRGSISTTLAPMPCGRRPGAANNVMFTAQYDSSCWDAAARQLARDSYGTYTHWAMGPIVQRGYSGTYPDSDWRADPDGFLDRMQELYDNRGADGIMRQPFIPAVFLLPDQGLCADGNAIDHACVERELTPVYSRPRFQQLARIVVLAWEPWYADADYLWGVQWMARTFPSARRYIHLPGGHGAPCNDDPTYRAGGEGGCWRAVAPYIHGFLLQDTWVFGGQTDGGRSPLQQHLYDLWDVGRRFATGYADWPTVGADGQPLDLVDFEYASYFVTSDPSRADESLDWGDAAMTAPPSRDPATGQTIHAAPYVIGYGDGGRVR